MRGKISNILIESEKRDELKLDLSEVVLLIKRFCNVCIEKRNNEKMIFNLFVARTYFENCLTLLKGIIEPEKNKFIVDLNKRMESSDVLEKYFENFLAILDMYQKELKQAVHESKILIPKFEVDMSIKIFREKLIDYMGTLIIIPLSNAILKYKILVAKLKKEKEEGTERDLFEYILFREIFIASKIKGSQERLKISKMTSMGGELHETNITKVGGRRIREEEPQKEKETLKTPPDAEEAFKLLFGEEEQEEEENV